MASVTFSASVGGDGSTVTDDSNASTGLDGGGHRTRFVPALAQVVAVAANTVTKATEAAASAASALNAPGTNATSTTSLTVGTGSKTLTIQTGKAYSVGQTVVIASTASPTNQMVGVITAHNSATGSLTVNVTQIGGSGTLSAWTVSMGAVVSSSLPSQTGMAGKYLKSDGTNASWENALQPANNLSDVSSVSTARTNLGLGSIATQAASAVALTGGTITGLSTLTVKGDATEGGQIVLGYKNITPTAPANSTWNIDVDASNNFRVYRHDAAGALVVALTFAEATGAPAFASALPVSSGGTGSTTAAGARTNLGLGSIATQASSSVSITGGSVTGITDLAIADGGTGASTASAARSNLGAAASGANSDITSLGGLTTALSVAQGGTGATTASAARTALGFQFYESGQTSVPGSGGSSGSTIWAHGFGAVPSMVYGVLRCLTAEHGYSIGDEVACEMHAEGGSEVGIRVWADATNVGFIRAQDLVQVPNKSTGAMATITSANWRVVLRALRIA